MSRREKILADPSVRYTVKDILDLSEGKDPLKYWLDVQLAADVLKRELDELIVSEGSKP